MMLPLHKKTKAEKQIRNLSFKNYNFGLPKKRVLVFEEKPPKNVFLRVLCFCFDSAVKTIDTQMSFWLAFLKTH